MKNPWNFPHQFFFCMATQYIGSRISLISKNDVRYEGILYSIDPTKLEVVLQNGKQDLFFFTLPLTHTCLLPSYSFPVQSFGTEDRVSENPIASSPGVFGFIAFSGPDIKELNVCEPVGPPEGVMGVCRPSQSISPGVGLIIFML